jgi:hypothetical protein
MTYLDRARAIAVLSVLNGIIASAADRPPANSVPGRPKAAAQAATKGSVEADKDKTSTSLDIELISNSSGTGLDSQTWARTLDRLGYSSRVRSGEEGEEPSISESNIGRFRTVRIVGRINGNSIEFPGKKFNAGEDKALREWLREREAYGAQGSPAGKPLWGLNSEQFEAIVKLLAKPIEVNTAGRELTNIAEDLGYGDEIPFRIHTSAQSKWRGEPAPLVADQEALGLSRGTGFAALLAEQGLCMRPLRTPGGNVELVVQLRSDVPDGWPVGWEPSKDARPRELVPEFFAFQPIGFREKRVIDVIADAEAQTGVKILVDLWKAREKKIDLKASKFGQPKQSTAWTLILASSVERTGLHAQYRMDETGRVFVWYTPFERGKPAPK